MNVILQQPLSDEEADLMRKARVGLYVNPYTRQTYLHRGQWINLPPQRQAMITMVLEELRKQEALSIEVPLSLVGEGNASE